MTRKFFVNCLAFGVLFLLCALVSEAQLPGNPTVAKQRGFPGPSIVKMQGTQLIVKKRNKFGMLAPAEAFKLRGVAYSPADIGDNLNSVQAARTELLNSLYVTDFPMIRAMNANTIRTFVDMGTGASAKTFLDQAYANNLWVLITLTPDSLHQPGDPSNTSIVTAYRDHPALLGWIIGNEWNLNFFYTPNSIATLIPLVQQTALLVKSLDPNHVVTSSLGFKPDHYNMGTTVVSPTFPFAAIVAGTPGVELWGFNVYRAGSLDPFFIEMQTLLPGKPYFLTEFGTDSWATTNATSSTGAGVSDQVTQAQTYTALWDELHRHLSATNPISGCVGGIAFEWSDEWWKWLPGSPGSHEFGGFPLYKTFLDQKTGLLELNFIGHPDSFSNEEYYGIVDVNRVPKQAYFDLQSAFSLSSLRKGPVPLTVKAQGGGSQALYWMRKRDLPFYLNYGSCCQTSSARGINILIMDRARGTISSRQNFDTWSNPAHCLSLQTFLASVTPGDIVMATVTDTVMSGSSGSCTTLGSIAAFNGCKTAFQQLGSLQFAQLKFWQPWTFIGVAGSPGVALAEASGVGIGGACGPAYNDAQISTSVELDADRDGIVDSLDLDNDNDGKSDVQETLNGTDVLDPAS
jgi:hypothetical protein